MSLQRSRKRFLLVSDDMMLGSMTRRRSPSGVASQTPASLQLPIRLHWKARCVRKDSYYVHLIEVLHNAGYKTEIWQLVDLITASKNLHGFFVKSM